MGSYHHSTLDARVAQSDALNRLHSYLGLAHSHPDIANWLYNNLGPTATPGECILSPDTFARSVATSTLQSYTDLAVNFAPQQASFTEYSENFIYTLYVPVTEIHDVALGYSFHAAAPRTGSSLLNDIFPTSKIYRGRYVYARNRRMLLILMENTPGTDVIAYIEWTSDYSRRNHYFVIPHEEYGLNNPPRRVICTGGSEADSLCRRTGTAPEAERTHAADAAAPWEEALPSGASDFVDGVWDGNINNLPKCMFHDLGCDDGGARSSWLRDAQVRCLARLTGGLIQFETRRRAGNGTPVRLIHGSFFSAHVVRDVFDGGRLVVRKAFEVRTLAGATETGCLEVLRKGAAQIYYSVVLWASTDQRLVAAQEYAAAELLIGKGDWGTAKW